MAKHRPPKLALIFSPVPTNPSNHPFPLKSALVLPHPGTRSPISLFLLLWSPPPALSHTNLLLNPADSNLEILLGSFIHTFSRMLFRKHSNHIIFCSKIFHCSPLLVKIKLTLFGLTFWVPRLLWLPSVCSLVPSSHVTSLASCLYHVHPWNGLFQHPHWEKRHPLLKSQFKTTSSMKPSWIGPAGLNSPASAPGNNMDLCGLFLWFRPFLSGWLMSTWAS